MSEQRNNLSIKIEESNVENLELKNIPLETKNCTYKHTHTPQNKETQHYNHK